MPSPAMKVQRFLGVLFSGVHARDRTLAREPGCAHVEELAGEERYRSLFDGIPVGLYRATLDGRILDVNPAFVHVMCYPDRETLLAMNAAEFYVDPAVRAQWTTLLERDGTVTGFESELRRFDGSTIWVRANARAVRDPSGRTAYLEGAIVDITEQKRAEEVARRRAAHLEALYELCRRLRPARSVDQMYPIIADQALDILQAAHGTLALLEPDKDIFTRAYTVGVIAEKRGSTFPAAGSRSGQVVQTLATFLTPDFSREHLPAWMDASDYADWGPLAIVPLRSEQETIGTLSVARRKSHGLRPFSDAEVRLLEGIAEIAGTAIGRARLHQNLQQAYVQMVLALAQAMEARDSYTAGHSERMVKLAEQIARKLGCPEEEVQDIRWGARLHDVGKIGIPDRVLNKPSGLNDVEWNMMRQHPILGEEILKPVERMRAVATLVRHHQERWDGTGYPDRLQGEAIPLGSRILAVVDAYGAMTEDRPYQPARPHADAIEEIRRNAGTQFDPRVMETFVGVIDAVVSAG